MRRAYRHDPRLVALDGAEDLPAKTDVMSAALDEVQRSALWHIVLDGCHDDAERGVARFCLAMGLTPAEVAGLHPELYASVDAVYRIKRNLLARLSRNEKLQKLMC
jgi:hypothetical protein